MAAALAGSFLEAVTNPDGPSKSRGETPDAPKAPTLQAPLPALDVTSEPIEERPVTELETGDYSVHMRLYGH